MSSTESSHTMHIGELAERTQLSLRTIRHYDEVGLLKPYGRTEGGFRLYSQEDAEQLLLIRRMKPLGFSIEEMRDLLAVIAEIQTTDGATNAQVRAEMQHFTCLAEERRAKLVDYLARADELITLMKSS